MNDRLNFVSADAKTPQRIRHELRALFDAGLGMDEAMGMVVPVQSNMKAAYRAEWKDWDLDRIKDEVHARVFASQQWVKP